MMSYLAKHYQNRSVFYGDTHEHSASGGTSDGKRPLRDWIDACHEKNLDFEAILDHRQVRHMYLPEFDEYCFLCGSEPGTHITDAVVELDKDGNRRDAIHYLMIFKEKGVLEQVLEGFPEFMFTGGDEGHFDYPNFTRDRFTKLVHTVMELDGFFVHPHPLSEATMHSDDPDEYVFADFTGIETYYRSHDYYLSPLQYELWKKILKRGHKVYACAGVDSHDIASGELVTTVYLPKLDRRVIVDVLQTGDFTAGNAGVKMCIGDTKMGGVHSFAAGDILEIEVGDIWHYDESKTYQAAVWLNEDVIYTTAIDGQKPLSITLPIEQKGYYRVEVLVEGESLPLALGNPIWVE